MPAGCEQRGKVWGLWSRPHPWKRDSAPLAIERGGLSVAHNIEVVAVCTVCSVRELQPLRPPFSVALTHFKSGWSPSTALIVSREEAEEILQEAVSAGQA